MHHKAGSGVTTDLLAHAINMAMWLIGQITQHFQTKTILERKRINCKIIETGAELVS